MGIDEEGTLAALKAIRHELIDPKIAEHRGRIVKTTGDGTLVEFASAVDAMRCAIEIQHARAERNAAISEDRRIEFRIGINVGDIIIDEGDIYGGDPFLNSLPDQFARLAARYNMPVCGDTAEFPRAGGFMSYGTDQVDAYRLAGTYAGRIVKGEKPADLPVQQSTKVQMVINLKAANAIGLTVPLPLLARADEVIE